MRPHFIDRNYILKNVRTTSEIEILSQLDDMNFKSQSTVHINI